MELPYQGRAIIEEHYNGIEINIPARKNWFIVIFLSFWLCGWIGGEIFALTEILTGGLKGPGGFLIIWCGAWTVGGVFAIRTWLWNVAGREIIFAGQRELSIERKRALFVKSKTFDLNEAKNFRAQDDGRILGPFGGRNMNNGRIDNTGTIRFDYGMKTIQFGAGLDEAEGNYIIQKLRDKKIIS